MSLHNASCSSDNKLSYNGTDGGIEDTLALNIPVWIVVLAVFFFARWRASKHMKNALVESPGWASLYFQSSKFGGGNVQDEEVIGDENTMSFWKWMPYLFSITDDQLRAVHGEDAIHFLSMERHLLVVLVILTVFSVGVILPVNYAGGDPLYPHGFARTTIGNIRGKAEHLYWVHTLIALLYLVVIFLALWHFVNRYKKKRKEIQVSDNVIFIRGFGKSVSDERLKDYFRDAYPDYTVVDIQRVYDIHGLYSLDAKRKEAQKKKEIYKSVLVEFNKRERISVGVGNVFCCCKQWKRDAIEYYTTKEEDLCHRCEVERKKVLAGKRMEAVFVAFSASSEAQNIIHKHSLFQGEKSQSLSPAFWRVTQAVVPEQIKWENLHVSDLLWWVKFLFINGALCAFLFFFTTPTIMLSSLPKLQTLFHVNVSMPTGVEHNVLFTVYLPTLLLLLLASLLPVFVAFTCSLESHWFQYNEQQYIMRKTAIYLLLIVVILPGLGLTSIDSLVAIKGEAGFHETLECIFLPSNGAFFVNYVISSAFIGTGLELLRLPSLIAYLWKWSTLKSSEGKRAALEKVQAPFAFGVEYAWILAIFTMTVTFSVACPLIVPFGVVYFVMKYWVDKYNLYFVFKAASFHGSSRIHFSAVHFAFGSGVILQFVILFYSVLRSGSVDANEIFSIVVIVVVLTGCIAYSVWSRFESCRQAQSESTTEEGNSISKSLLLSGEDESAEYFGEKGSYLPEVLKCEFKFEDEENKAPHVFRHYSTFDDHSTSSASNSAIADE